MQARLRVLLRGKAYHWRAERKHRAQHDYEILLTDLIHGLFLFSFFLISGWGILRTRPIYSAFDLRCN